MLKNFHRCGRNPQAIVVTAVEEGADTKIKVEDTFLSVADLSARIGYSVSHVQKLLSKPPAEMEYLPGGPATLRGITFWYQKDYRLFTSVNETVNRAKTGGAPQGSISEQPSAQGAV